VQTREPGEVLPKLAAVERAVDGGLSAAGFVTYEAASGFDDALRTHPGGKLPLVWFGLFRRVVEQSPLADECSEDVPSGPWLPSITRERYEDAIDRIKDYIARGHTYQVNFTYRLRTRTAGAPWRLFRRMCAAQPAAYGAYLDTGEHIVCSASPELFFELNGDRVLSRPMKGTARRGLTLEEDRRRRATLADSPKERAENAMIVDMMRNDLGRLASAEACKWSRLSTLRNTPPSSR